MNARRLVGLIVVLALVTLALVSVTNAQGPAPRAPRAPRANLGTAFTYQGQLKSGGNVVNGNCDFAFRLYDAASGGTLIGNPITTTVPVTNGLFTAQLDFGANAFNGDARWLDFQVRCPAGSGSFTALTTRQALTPAPYALALPGLFTQQNATSPNLIGGYNGNTVTNGVVGATIGGGGQSGFSHQVTDDYGTIGGGYQNQAGDNAGTTSDKSYATVGGGATNTASGEYATVAGGDHNTANGNRATIGGGSRNIASKDHTTIPGGESAHAFRYGEMAYASGFFIVPGDAQTSVYVLRNQLPPGPAPMPLFLDGIAQVITVPPNRTVTFDVLVSAREQSPIGTSAGWTIRGVAKEQAGAVIFIGAPVVTLLAADPPVGPIGWNVSMVIVGNGFSVQATNGLNPVPVRWVATVRTSEVNW